MYFIMLKTAHAGFRGAESGAAPQRQTAFQSFELFMVLIMKTRMIRILCAAAFLALGLGGCSRSQMNFQIAEAIGTAGMYENNEPVETPQMAEKRKAQEESDRAEAVPSDIIMKKRWRFSIRSPASSPRMRESWPPAASMSRAGRAWRNGKAKFPICASPA